MEFYKRTNIDELDLTKPICSESCDGEYTYLLLPRTHEGSYGILGYDWFNITTGTWNSCVHWKTKEEAVYGYGRVRNCEIKII